MATIKDTPTRYGVISRVLHWGMALLFAAQFASAAARALLERENALRETLWSYHTNLGATLFVLVALRGIWGLLNIPNRPPHSGAVGTAALAGHVAIYVLMFLVPFTRLLASAGSERGFSYFGIPIFPARETEIAWMQIPANWHGEMGWLLLALIAGHIAMAIVWHGIIQKDHTLQRMTGGH
ncbi:cytochrome b [Loktanella sp. TSTF-M6]|uniref:Cytochrome b n=1 Tax=Loktanella gaetbuli TaxID=2881335 RepID=A0ABS8BW23_9RHOB|nr:cytochrome b [Loktanella gaetbuli]MCB5199947.1 cytochrome b [Loktanella gaetbuli]